MALPWFVAKICLSNNGLIASASNSSNSPLEFLGTTGCIWGKSDLSDEKFKIFDENKEEFVAVHNCFLHNKQGCSDVQRGLVTGGFICPKHDLILVHKTDIEHNYPFQLKFSSGVLTIIVNGSEFVAFLDSDHRLTFPIVATTNIPTIFKFQATGPTWQISVDNGGKFVSRDGGVTWVGGLLCIVCPPGMYGPLSFSPQVSEQAKRIIKLQVIGEDNFLCDSLNHGFTCDGFLDHLNRVDHNRAIKVQEAINNNSILKDSNFMAIGKADEGRENLVLISPAGSLNVNFEGKEWFESVIPSLRMKMTRRNVFVGSCDMFAINIIGSPTSFTQSFSIHQTFT